jgi:hypothetical protein
MLCCPETEESRLNIGHAVARFVSQKFVRSVGCGSFLFAGTAMNRPILNQLLLDLTERDRAVEEFRELVGPIVLLADPLRPASLSHLLTIPLGDIDTGLRRLHSVLDVPADPKKPTRLPHLSFRNFLVDPRGQDRNRFYVDEKRTHDRPVFGCILDRKLANGSLHRSLCNESTHPYDVGVVRACKPSSVQVLIDTDFAYARFSEALPGIMG